MNQINLKFGESLNLIVLKLRTSQRFKG